MTLDEYEALPPENQWLLCRLRVVKTGGRWCVLMHGHDGGHEPWSES